MTALERPCTEVSAPRASTGTMLATAREAEAAAILMAISTARTSWTATTTTSSAAMPSRPRPSRSRSVCSASRKTGATTRSWGSPTGGLRAATILSPDVCAPYDGNPDNYGRTYGPASGKLVDLPHDPDLQIASAAVVASREGTARVQTRVGTDAPSQTRCGVHTGTREPRLPRPPRLRRRIRPRMILRPRANLSASPASPRWLTRRAGPRERTGRAARRVARDRDSRSNLC